MQREQRHWNSNCGFQGKLGSQGQELCTGIVCGTLFTASGLLGCTQKEV